MDNWEMTLPLFMAESAGTAIPEEVIGKYALVPVCPGNEDP